MLKKIIQNDYLNISKQIEFLDHDKCKIKLWVGCNQTIKTELVCDLVIQV